ncbi:MAG: nucleoside phosphorylase [Deltaproteobacteria bacterium]|nr:nucleoside phosphorylase [Deltaproteobacteria bacterium]MBW2052222.1 nucleoside phosphorylase [Deltaproteobacteria bacterium]MBW2141045.1 nucleoside phosphorylase [Deltaproteobacteria bacterium]MBW2323480.1 nucleoside phosphorylase [Deltaproteobacteria bacterium]
MNKSKESHSASGSTEKARPERAVLAFSRKELRVFKALKKPGRSLRPIYGITEVISWPDLLLAGPILGAPQAVMVMEYLGLKGARVFLSLGSCGSIQPDLSIGQIVIPQTALSEEGTSAHYPLENEPASADPKLAGRLAEFLTEQGLDFRAGRVWTTDAPFRETADKIQRYSDQGILAVDMEASALMTAARFRKFSYAGLMVVSDELRPDEHNFGFNSPLLTEGLTNAAKAIMKVLI